jgi:tight adherence protein C
MNSLVAALIQADRMGGSLGTTLRVYADDMRTRQRQRAEELAAKIPVKLIFPIFFCIFPAIFVVTGVPAAIRVFRELARIVSGPP